MGGETSKEQLEQASNQIYTHSNNQKHSKQPDQNKNLQNSRKTEFSSGTSETKSIKTHKDQPFPSPDPNPQSSGQKNPKSSNLSNKNPKIQFAIKQQLNESHNLKHKSNPQNQNQLFKKYCQILQLNSIEASNLAKVKKVYPQLAKKYKNNCQKLIQLNQAFLFLRSFYFKTQFGTTAVYHNDKVQIFQKHCNVLDLSQEAASNIESVKGNFASKITVYRLNKRKRIELSIAFEYLANRIFKVQKSDLETKLIDAVIVCDKETLMQHFAQDKKLMNLRQKGSNYPLLYIAVRSGHYEVVELILGMGCSKDFQMERSTPLHCAAFYEHKQILQLLLSYGFPHNVKNSFGVEPIDEAGSVEIKKILENVKKDEVQDLILRLKSKGISVGCINIRDSDGLVMARKIFLSNYFDQYDDHVDGFHGTAFEALESIAIHGLKKPGTMVDGTKIKVAAGHINEERLMPDQAEQITDNWHDAIFLSESYNYATCPCYSKDQILMDHISGQRQQWAPLIQAKIKKDTYTTHPSTTIDHQVLLNEPYDLQFRVQDCNNVTAVAVILLRRQYMREKRNKNYIKTTELILNSRQETLFRQNTAQNNLKKFSHIIGKVQDNHFDSLLSYLAKENLLNSACKIYSEDNKEKTLIGRKIKLNNGITDLSHYVTAYYATDYESLRLLKNYGIKHFLNERKDLFVSPNLFEYSQMNSLRRLKMINASTGEKEEWGVFLKVQLHKNVFLESKRTEDFIMNWKNLTHMRFRIKAELLQIKDARFHFTHIIFVKLNLITSDDKYKRIVNKIQ